MHTIEETAEFVDSVSEGAIRPRFRNLRALKRARGRMSLRLCLARLRRCRAMLRKCRAALAKCRRGEDVKKLRIRRAASKIARQSNALRRQALAQSPTLRRRAARVAPVLRARRAAARRRMSRGPFRRLFQRRPSSVRGIGVGHDVGARRRYKMIPVGKRVRLVAVARGRAALQWQLKSKKWLTLGWVLKGAGGKPTFRKTYSKFKMQPALWRRIVQVLGRASGKNSKTSQKRFAARKKAVQQKAVARRRMGSAAVRTGSKGVIPLSSNTFLKALPGGRVFYLFSRRKGGKWINLGAIRAERRGLVWIGRYPKFRPPASLLERIRTRLPGQLRKMAFVEVPAKAAKGAAQAQQRGASITHVARLMRKQATVRLPFRKVAPPPPPPVSPHVPPEASPGAVAPEAVLKQRELPAHVKARQGGKPIPKQAVPLKIWPVRDPRYLAFLGATAWYPYGRGWNTAPWHFADLRGDADGLSGDTPFDSFDDANEEVSYQREARGA